MLIFHTFIVVIFITYDLAQFTRKAEFGRGQGRDRSLGLGRRIPASAPTTRKNMFLRRRVQTTPSRNGGTVALSNP
jgi:hypothetical protein